MDRNLIVTKLPIIVGTNEEYEKALEDKLNELLEALKKTDFLNDGTLIDDVKTNCEMIKCIYKELKNGDNSSSEKLLQQFIKPFIDEKFMVSELDNSYAFRGIAPFKEFWSRGYGEEYEHDMRPELTFFRVRTKDKDDAERIDELKDIVHLPYTLSSKATEMRFSRAGHPCLYLGTTSLACAKECQWDKKNQELYGAAFVPTTEGKQLKVLNLAISQYVIDGVYNAESDEDAGIRLELQKAMIKMYPLILAISFTVQDTSRDEKAEYKISQCLMETLHNIGIDGIAYLSARGEDEFQYPHGVNLALPAFDIDERRMFSKFCEMFRITLPVKYEMQGGGDKKSFINDVFNDSENFTCTVPIDGKNVFYGGTEYALFDNYLCSQEMHLINE